MWRMAVAIGLAACALAGCGGDEQAAPPADQATSAAGGSAGVVHVRAGDELVAQDAAGGGERRTLPAGVADAAFSTLYAARASDGRTTVEAIDIASGEVRASRVLDGTWELPRLGPAGTPIGLSPGGATLVLAWRPGEDEQAASRREDRWQSRFALLPASLDTVPTVIALDGNFSYDAIASGGGRCT